MSDISLGSRAGVGEEEAVGSAVSWAAVLAGAFVASAFSIALLALGAALGLGSVSPWSNNNASATTFGILAAVWLIAVQLFSSGIGGYLAGRLRTRWVGVHTHEVYFRDTAHGLIVWGVGAVISAMLLSSAVSSAISGAARMGETAVQAAGSAAAGPAAQLTGQAANTSMAISLTCCSAPTTRRLLRMQTPRKRKSGGYSRALYRLVICRQRIKPMSPRLWRAGPA